MLSLKQRIRALRTLFILRRSAVSVASLSLTSIIKIVEARPSIALIRYSSSLTLILNKNYRRSIIRYKRTPSLRIGSSNSKLSSLLSSKER